MPATSKKKAVTRTSKTLHPLQKPYLAAVAKTKAFMARRPHRSFRMTKRRDYRRSLQLPGYVAFTGFVNKTLWKHKRTFLWLGVVYALLTVFLVGVGSQETYNTLTNTLQEVSAELFAGNVGQLGQAVLVFTSIATYGLNSAPTEAQQIYIVLLALLVWLTTVWLLRNLLAGHKVKLRDGLYSAGSPIVATFLVGLVFILQLIPVGIAAVGYSAASGTGLLDGGVATMLFWCAAALLLLMSLYWVVSTFFALIIVTLPGMYPGKALRSAGDMLVGRRLRILLRLLWMLLCLSISGALFVIPIILINAGLVNVWPVVAYAPIVPIALTLYSVVAFIWGASYVYLLYRRVVDDDAQPV